MKIPAFLKPGDLIRIVAPAKKYPVLQLDFAVNTIKNWGFKVIVGKNLLESWGGFAGTDEQRLADLQEALDDDQCKAIICARGGYGSVRILDDLNFERFLNHPKWIVGYSDITFLLMHVLRQHKTAAIHGTMPLNINDEKERFWAIESLKNTLTGNLNPVKWTGNSINFYKPITGTLVGGNLSILQNLIGTPSEPDWNKSILFVEDVGEQLYHLDRQLHHFGRAGIFKKITALLVGGFTNMTDDNPYFINQTAEDLIAWHAQKAGINAIFGFPAGHIKNNQSVVLGLKTTITQQNDVFTLQHG